MSTVQITGKTFDCRDLIRSAGGVWQTATKTWAIDSDKWADLTARKPILTAGCRIAGGATTTNRTASPRINAVCRRCGSYCYGDCTA